ncbi:MAG: cadmium-translocating P-type ATPase [Armatimonadetes bacterium]|nr:cadmium-translocating P-type ATPase [Armatimonadota bacterium]
MNHTEHNDAARQEHAEHRMHGGPELRPTRERHAGHDVEVLKRKFWVALILTIPVLIYSEGVQMLLRFEPPGFPGSDYVPFIFGTIIFFYGGVFFIRGAAGELLERTPGMMTLVALAISVAFVYSLAVTLGLSGEALYWELSTLITVMLFGHWMEMSAVGRARGALSELVKLMPDDAERITDSETQTVPVSELRPEDVVLVRPGGKVPADGEVIDGSTHVNEAMITGESRPVSKEPGDQVIAGTVNEEGAVRVRITKTGKDTALARIMALVESAQQSRSRAQALADRAAYWLTLIAVVAGGITFAVWVALAPTLGFALERTVTVLVIACPHALGLAIPLVIAISTTLAARNGLLVRERLALENARNLDVVVFDKTGTLTRGEHGVVAVHTVDREENEALAMMAGVEAKSEHVIARGIVRSAVERGLSIPEAADFRALPGRGVEGRVNGRNVRVGGPKLLESQNIEVPQKLSEELRRARESGQTIVYLVEDGRVSAAVALADIIREESYEAVSGLKTEGISVAMITGDSEDVARSVAAELGIDEYFAEVLPEDKARMIEQLKEQGRRVAMVGDGVNDAPALVTADVGIAIGAGTDVAVEAGSIVLVRNDPRDVVRIVRLSKASYSKMLQNLAWATGYNVVAIPLAAGVLAGYGIVLPPALGALFMSASTVIVALNSQLLRRLRMG